MLTQTALGKAAGMSSTSVGKKLVEMGLKSKETNQATPQAVQNKLAKIVTYTKNEKNAPMTLWDQKVVKMISDETPTYTEQEVRNKTNPHSEKNKNNSHPPLITIEELIAFLKQMKLAHENFHATGDDSHEDEYDQHYDSFILTFNKHKNNKEITNAIKQKIHEEQLFNFVPEHLVPVLT